jgi:hypothetical protein
MIVSKHVVNIYLMQSPNQNLPLSKECPTFYAANSTVTATEFRQLFYCQFEKTCVA